MTPRTLALTLTRSLTLTPTLALSLPLALSLSLPLSLNASGNVAFLTQMGRSPEPAPDGGID
jgi:hypothetical protein